MAKLTSPEYNLIDTYETVTISFLPIAAQIRHHFPVIENVKPPRDLLLPVLLTESQLLHAFAVPPLREGLRGTAENIKLIKKIEAIQLKLQQEQLLIHTWHDDMVNIHNSKSVEKDYSNVIDQLNTSAKNIITIQKKLQETKLKLKKLLITQHIVTVAQDREWVRYEEAFVEAVLKEMDKHKIKIDEELKENIMKKRGTLDAILEKFKLRNLPIPKEIEVSAHD